MKYIQRTSLLTKHFSIPGITKLDAIVSSFSLTGRVLFSLLAIIFCISGLWLLGQVNNAFLVEVPHVGGKMTEGVIGLPRFINPLLAVTEGDKDISALVYSGLLRHMPDGSFVPDLAESYTVSADGRIYIFKLKEGLTFHDSTPLTADDVEFTIRVIQDDRIQSVKEANWEGVSVEKINDREVKFILRRPYVPFLENATLGILPKHLWKDVTPETITLNNLNIEPIGSGPYKITSSKKDSAGIPTYYSLTGFSSYARGIPYIEHIDVLFFENEKSLVDAYESGIVDAINGISPLAAIQLEKSGSEIVTATLPRVFGLFFNQNNNPALAAKEVRQALDLSVNREYIVNTVLQGFGTPLGSPVPRDFLRMDSSATSTTSFSPDVDAANALLEKNGWIKNQNGIREKKTAKGTTTLAFSISTPDAAELKQVADILKTEWYRIGAEVDVKVFEGGYLNQNIIRPRKYESLLFGQVINRNLDLFAFWHSSQTQDPGLNIALYANKNVDAALERLRSAESMDERMKEYALAASEIKKDVPALFLYAPEFIYVKAEEARNVSIGHMSVPSERFATIKDWYIDTDHIWSIFLK